MLRSVLWPLAIMSIAPPQHRAGHQRQHHRRLQAGLPRVSQLPARLGHLQRALRLRRPALPVPARRHAADGAVRLPAVRASRYWFIPSTPSPSFIAAYLLLRLFNFTLTSVAAPALLLAMFCTETRHQHAGFHQHQRLRPAARRCCSSGGCSTARSGISGGPASRSG